jgi:hypothetical protein
MELKMQHPPPIAVGVITSTNPHLWLNITTMDQAAPSYQIATATPGVDWMSVNQFCSLLALRWLQARTHATPPSPYSLSIFPNAEKLTMAQQLINYAHMDAQVTFAIEELGGTRRTREQAIAGVESDRGTYAIGTKIWAGSDIHVIAIYLSSSTEYILYDPDNGVATTHQRADFPALMTALRMNAFVVRQ